MAYQKSLYDWCIENELFDVLDDFDSERNNVYPNDVSCQDNTNLYWFTCHKCGKKYFTKLYSVYRNKDNRCPDCTNTKVRLSQAQTDMATGIEENHQEYLIKEYDNTKNIKDIFSYKYNSSDPVWWKCSTCGGEWETKIFVRTTQSCGCPYCAGKIASEDNNLKKLFLDYGFDGAIEWWDKKENGCDIKNALPGKRSGHHWMCPECGHKFNKKISTSNKVKSILLQCERCGCTYENGTMIYGKFHPENNGVYIDLHFDESDKTKETLLYIIEHCLNEQEKFVIKNEFYTSNKLSETDLSKVLNTSKDNIKRTYCIALRKIKAELLKNNIFFKESTDEYENETPPFICEHNTCSQNDIFILSKSQQCISLYKTELSNKIIRALNKQEIYTLNQVAILTDDELLQIKHIGEKELFKIKLEIDFFKDLMCGI